MTWIGGNMPVRAKRSLSLVIAAAVIGSLLGARALAQTARFYFDISDQTLSQALRTFAEVSGQDIVFTEDLVAGLRVTSLRGTFTAGAAMRRLLEGTPLIARRSASGALMIEPVPIANRESTNSIVRAAERSDLVDSGPQPDVARQSTVDFPYIDEVTVTGSRVVRDGYEGPTPVTILGREQLNADAPINIANAINQLPVLAGSTTPQSSSTSTSSGLSSTNRLNLRNMGAGRTLVLLDGRRVAPSDLYGVADINTIPSTLISRVDIVTGGASAPYGSDAVVGIVNFVLDKEFTGIKGDLMAGQTTYGDDQQYKAELAIGAPFADGRGHFLLGTEHADVSGGVAAADRPWNRNAKALPNPNYTATNGEPFFIVRAPVEFSAMAPGLLIASGPLRGLEFTGAGSVQQFQYGSIVGGTGMVGGADTDKSIGSMDSAQRRSNVHTYASYDITDELQLWGELGYAKSHSSFVCCPQFFSGIGVDRITIQRDNAYLPADVADRMASLGITSFAGGSTNADLPPLQQAQEREARRYALGIRSSLDLAGTDWAWNAYVQRGISRADIRQPQLNRVKYHRAIDAVIDPSSHAIVCRSTLSDPGDGCVPFNRLGLGTATRQAIDYVSGESSYKETFTQDVAEISFTGEPFSSWAGAVSGAFGAQYRNEKVTSYADVESIGNQWFSANFKPTFGSYHVLEGFLETVVPLARDASWAKSLDLNAALRVTDYSTSGMVATWKVGAIYQPISQLRVRATQSRDIRSPGLGDLFRAGAVNRANTRDPFMNNAEADFNRLMTGNPRLAPETAETTRFGLVYQPQWLPGFSASVDYFRINVMDAFTLPSPEIVLERCFAGDQYYCDSVERGPTGEITFMRVMPINADTHATSGIDFEVSYHQRLANLVPSWGGDLTLSLLATRTHTNRSIQNNEVSEMAGQNGGLTISAPGIPTLRWQARLTYSNEPFIVNLVGRGLSSGVTDSEWIECTSNCPPSTVLNRTIDDNRIDGAIYLDAALSYQFRKGTEAYVKVDNLLDKEPPVVAPDYFLSPGVNPSLYDVLGRMYRTGVRFSF